MTIEEIRSGIDTRGSGEFERLQCKNLCDSRTYFIVSLASQ
jgi:hypothetical protein